MTTEEFITLLANRVILFADELSFPLAAREIYEALAEWQTQQEA